MNGLLVNAFLAKHRQEVVNQMLIAMSTVGFQPATSTHVLRDKQAILQEANLYQAYLCEANLEGANLREAFLQQAYLCEANLEGANLREAYLCEANLERANLTGATADAETDWPEGFDPKAAGVIFG